MAESYSEVIELIAEAFAAKRLVSNLNTRASPMVVRRFEFASGHHSELSGFHRGAAPSWKRLDSAEESIGIFTDGGDYYSIHVDRREESRTEIWSYKIGDVEYHHPITGCYTMPCKVNPKNGSIRLPKSKAERQEQLRTLEKLEMIGEEVAR